MNSSQLWAGYLMHYVTPCYCDVRGRVACVDVRLRVNCHVWYHKRTGTTLYFARCLGVTWRQRISLGVTDTTARSGWNEKGVLAVTHVTDVVGCNGCNERERV